MKEGSKIRLKNHIGQTKTETKTFSSKILGSAMELVRHHTLSTNPPKLELNRNPMNHICKWELKSQDINVTV